MFPCPHLAASLEKEKTYCIGTLKKGRQGCTKFNQKQVDVLKKGEDILNVEFISVARCDPSMVNCSSEGNVSLSNFIEE